MSRAIVVVIVMTAAIGTACASGGTKAPDLSPATERSVTSVVPRCLFEVGDTVRRAGGGAVVPPPGQGVAGFLDGAERSGSLQIDTNTDGIVTITSQVSGQAKRVEKCQLPGA